jgi:hypothetical protein
VEAAGPDEGRVVQPRFLIELVHELTLGTIADVLGQLVVLQHPINVQVHPDSEVVALGQHRCRLIDPNLA